jgi:type I restriction enzyme R subunit
MSFEFFDPEMDLRITVGNLPHWFQPGVTYFITFRTDDSLPADVFELWCRRREDWLQRHGIDTRTSAWSAKIRTLPIAQQNEFHNRFSRELMDDLDKGQGVCVLKRPNMAKIVAESLRYDDGKRYLLGDFVVMPNHVHVLSCLLGETNLENQCYSWKKYTATQINRSLGRRGRFWQEESFDHLVRTPEQFEYLRKYIAENPIKAGLQEGEYLYWRCSDV